MHKRILLLSLLTIATFIEAKDRARKASDSSQYHSSDEETAEFAAKRKPTFEEKKLSKEI